MITRIRMSPGNRMFRPFAFGQHDGRTFGRTDLWWVGWRFTDVALTVYLTFWIFIFLMLIK